MLQQCSTKAVCCIQILIITTSIIQYINTTVHTNQMICFDTVRHDMSCLQI